MKRFVTLWFIVQLCWICVQSEQAYTVQNEAVEPFAGLKENLASFDNMKLVGRERFLNGTVVFHDDLNSDSHKFQVELFSSPHGDGNYKRLPMGVPRTGLCEGFKDLYTKMVQPSFIHGENTNFPFVPEDGLCPIPAGEYYIKDIEFNTESWPTQVPRGILKAVLTFFKNNVDAGGTVIKMKIEDRD